MDVAFVGLGIMGMPMAVNLSKNGRRVRVFARRSDVRREARSRGLDTAESIADAVRGAHVVITMLTDGTAVREVVLGQGGVLESIASSTVYIDMSTIAPSDWEVVLEACVAADVSALDAPVSGGEQGAIEGTLSIMAGGERDVVESVREVLELMGTVVRVGGPGAGQIVKAANQLVVAGNIQLVAEALIVLEKGGVDQATALDVLSRGLAGSAVIQRKREALLNRVYEPGFTLSLHAKDLGIVADAARSSRLSLPLTATVTQLVNAAVATGRGDCDHSALYDLALETNGLAT